MTTTRAVAKTGLVYDPRYKLHDSGEGHPESPARCDAIMGALADKRFEGRLVRIEPLPADEAQITAVHDADYVRTARREIESGVASLSTGDTAVGKDSYMAAVLAAGGVIAAVDAVFAGHAKNAFCVVRPPGHHATRSRGMGFCIFNNVAIAARHARKKHGVERVLIADWDVHHANGTQDIFYEDGSVMLFDTHQSPLYPGTGAEIERGRGKGEGLIINCPFPRGAGRKEILGAFQDKLVPAADKFKPQLVLVSAGFDSRIGDPLGGFTLSDDDFADVAKVVLDVARRHAGGRLVATLEGGYSLKGIASAAAAVVDVMA